MFRQDSILQCGWVGFKSPQLLGDASDSNIYIALQVILSNIDSTVLKPNKGCHTPQLFEMASQRNM